jgi:hypothetical protein
LAIVVALVVPEKSWLKTVDAFVSGERGSVALDQAVVPL